MNERIKELARKANMVEVEYSPGFPDIRYPKNFEKFAELIVRECANIANKQFSTASGLDDRDCWTANEMKQHFGVE
jgi:hypothetical protein